MTFSRDIRNMTDEKLVVEIEQGCSGEKIDVRTILNVNAIDTVIELDVDQFEVTRFEVPIIKLRQENCLELFLQAGGRKSSHAVYKLRRIELKLENDHR